MQNADISILTIQQAADRPEELYKEADYVVKNVSEVVTIVQKLLTSTGRFDRDDCDASYKR
jgi:Cu+-exporting ATPase